MPSINIKKLKKRTNYALWKWDRNNSKTESMQGVYQVVGWYLHGREIDPPKKLHAAEQAIEFHVRDVETGALLVLTKDPNGLGAMFDHNRRVTFHEA